ncbi:cytochrome c family protein [Paracoccus sp. (in: a-proteobacteria)]|uniref:c-type cytochrome n=1 Tax=Paracoccus sp. TaxID=267 RepID=UPI0026DF8DAA|nr:cytochrome c family protein [Paracoccus sp. (in: a-proteobacteria)]MDO5646692.1 cytochrome c family protein [Paracoccus sp. (in: a-proteobacteria)]
MFNTMTVTKAAGAIIGSLLFLMLVGWAASGLYSVGHDGHGDDHAQAYTIPVPETGGAAAAEPEPVDVAALIAQADLARGEREWAKCRSCHQLNGNDGVGPHLNGVVNRDKAAVAGFNYSSAAQNAPGEWTPENLFGFIENPRGYMPGTTMSFAGIRDAQARADLIAFLETQN